MKTKELIREIKNVFVPPVKKYYFGYLAYGVPYFYPMNFNPNILSIRKLQLRPQEELHKYHQQYTHLRRETDKFKNLPMVRRAKDWIVKLFDNYYWIQIGWPIAICSNELGWKDKWNTPRFEWCPAFHIFFFNLQFCIWWTAPDGDNDQYYETILNYLYYKEKDIKKVKKDFGWVNNKGESTWKEEYLINKT